MKFYLFSCHGLCLLLKWVFFHLKHLHWCWLLLYSSPEKSLVWRLFEWMQQMLRLRVTVNPIWHVVLVLPVSLSYCAQYDKLHIMGREWWQQQWTWCQRGSPLSCAYFPKYTEMLLHLGPVMQIRHQAFRITSLPSQHGHITFLLHWTT